MLKLGKKVQYALVALFHLDRVAPGSRVTTRDLSCQYDVPEQHLGKVLHRLVRAGVLRSTQGVQGGYDLACDLELLRLGDLLEALDPDAEETLERDHTILTVFPACYVQGLAHEVERQVLDHVHGLRLSELLAQVHLPQLNPFALEVSA